MSDEDSTPARPASTPELREAGPWILVLAAASLAWWLTLPLAAWALGSSPRWWAPLAGGALVRQAVVPALRALASRRLRPLLSSLVAARALDSGAFESEPTVLAPIAQRLEGALVDAAPELLASSVGAAAFAIVAARALPTSWALATAFACAVAAGLRLAARPWLDASSDALLDAHRAEAHRLAGAARGRWEITGPARARFLEEARAIALRVARAEQVHHARLRAVRSAQLALFLAPLAWVLWTRARAGVPVTLRDQALVLPALAPLLAALRAVDALSHAQRALARLAVGAPRGGARTLPDAPIELRDVTVRYGDRLALDRVNLTLPARGITTVVGPNGAGKSTLARVLAGALAPSEGRCAAGGIALADVAPGDVAFVPQNPCIVESLSALDNVRLAAPDAAPAAVSAALAALGLPIALDRPASALSRGEQRRLAIARAVLRRPRLLVLDEPDAWLDLAGRADLAATLRHAAASCPVVLVTHRADLVEHDARVVVLSSAHTVEAEGPAAAVLATSPTARALLAAMPDEALRFAAEPGTRGG